MKSQFVRTVLTAGFAALLGSLTLSAQNTESAKIPFAFQANHTSMPAGDYTITRANELGIFQITSRTGSHSVLVNAPVGLSAKSKANPHLTFRCYGTNRVLSEIWMPASETGNGRAPSAVEHDLQRKLEMAAMISVPLKSR